MAAPLLEILEFRSNNTKHRPILEALALLRRHADSKAHSYPPSDSVPLEGVVKGVERGLVVETDPEGNERINRLNYEVCILAALRD